MSRDLQLLRSPTAMQRLARQWRRSGTPVGLVPTMGYLHAGHLSLVRAARRRIGPAGKVVVSIYVNPTQFAPTEDLSRYPRDLQRDLQLCQTAGADAVFAPSDAAMYPARYSTYVVEEELACRMEGRSRPSHFRGVTTIVARLFNLILPDVAVFGAKDWQQAAIVKRMVADLNFPLRIVVAPTMREPDGVAMSSRNKYLTGDLRPQARVLSQAIKSVRKKVATRTVPAAKLKTAVARWVKTTPAARLDYVEFFEPNTLEPVKRVKRGAHMALAVFIGNTRLIDNGRL